MHAFKVWFVVIESLRIEIGSLQIFFVFGEKHQNWASREVLFRPHGAVLGKNMSMREAST